MPAYRTELKGTNCTLAISMWAVRELESTDKKQHDAKRKKRSEGEKEKREGGIEERINPKRFLL